MVPYLVLVMKKIAVILLKLQVHHMDLADHKVNCERDEEILFFKMYNVCQRSIILDG